MSRNKEEIKNKIIYRSSYRGTKEMDIYVNSFVEYVINDLNIDELVQLNKLVNLNDEEFIDISFYKSNQKFIHFFCASIVRTINNFFF